MIFSKPEWIDPVSSGHGIHPPRRGPFYMGPSQHLRQDTVTRIEGLTAQSRTFKDAQIEDWTIRKADQRISLPLMSITTHHRRDSTWFRPLQSLTRQLSGLPSPYTFFHPGFQTLEGKALCPFFPSRQDTVHNILRSLAVFGGAIHPSIRSP